MGAFSPRHMKLYGHLCAHLPTRLAGRFPICRSSEAFSVVEFLGSALGRASVNHAKLTRCWSKLVGVACVARYRASLVPLSIFSIRSRVQKTPVISLSCL
jgi:hypothetical protein